jgi:hypothetical protein
MNLSVFRVFPWKDQQRLEFRVEAFNLFNTPNFNFPGMSVSNPGTFGRITSTISNPREMQFAVKFYF